MPVKLQLTKAAAADLENLFNYGFDRFGEKAANAYREGLLEHLVNLTHFPEAYPEDDGLAPPGRVAPYNQHVILYAYRENHVLIGRIRHHAEDWRR